MKEAVRTVLQERSVEPQGAWWARHGAKIGIAGFLAMSGAIGLVLNRNTPATAMPQPMSAVSLASDTAPTEALTPAAGSSTETLVRSSVSRVRFGDVTPPDDPFQPSHADPPAAAAVQSAQPGQAIVRSGTGAAGGYGGGIPGGRAPVLPSVNDARGGAPAAAAPAGAPAGTSSPRAAELALTGIVQGDTPVAVVKYSGQSFFLKIGDQVADTWRLVEIKERSAVFQLGAQRVEIPIKGGSSE